MYLFLANLVNSIKKKSFYSTYMVIGHLQIIDSFTIIILKSQTLSILYCLYSTQYNNKDSFTINFTFSQENLKYKEGIGLLLYISFSLVEAIFLLKYMRKT